MTVRLRLMRMGKKKQPTYRIVAADQRAPRDGKFIEIVGVYDPRPNPSRIDITQSKAVNWLRNGAQPSDRVQKLLEMTGTWDAFKEGVTVESLSEKEASAVADGGNAWNVLGVAKPAPEAKKRPSKKSLEKEAEAAAAAAEAAEEAGDEPAAEEAAAEESADAPEAEASAEEPEADKEDQ